MNIFNSTDDLLKYFASFILFHAFFTDNIIEQLSPLHKLHDQEQMFWGLDDLVKLNDVGMADQFEDVDLSGNSLDICHIDDSILFKNFYCNFLSSWDVCGKLHFSEGTLSKCFF